MPTGIPKSERYAFPSRPRGCCWVYVAVDDAAAVRGIERTAQLLGDDRRVPRPVSSATHDVGEVAAAEQPHHEVRRARLAPVVVERHDVRVLESGESSASASNRRMNTGSSASSVTDDLDGHLAADHWLVGAVLEPNAPTPMCSRSS